MLNFDDIIADFAFLEDWDDRYKYLIDLGRALPRYPDDRRDENHKVRGCASQVWLDLRLVDGKIEVSGDSDASIVKGLVALLIALFSGRTPKEILDLDVTSALAPLDLASHITPQRSNGVSSMASNVRTFAEAALATSQKN